MAEKEERILILTGNKDNYPAWNYSHGPLYLDEEYYDGISRTEAIERMAKVLRKKLFKNEGPTQKIKEQGLEKEYYEYVDFCCTYIAEAALNALLSKED